MNDGHYVEQREGQVQYSTENSIHTSIHMSISSQMLHGRYSVGVDGIERGKKWGSPLESKIHTYVRKCGSILHTTASYTLLQTPPSTPETPSSSQRESHVPVPR